MASQIIDVSIVYIAVCSGVCQRKHHNSASLVFVRGIHRWQIWKTMPTLHIHGKMNTFTCCLQHRFGNYSYPFIDGRSLSILTSIAYLQCHQLHGSGFGAYYQYNKVKLLLRLGMMKYEEAMFIMELLKMKCRTYVIFRIKSIPRVIYTRFVCFMLLWLHCQSFLIRKIPYPNPSMCFTDTAEIVY